MLGILAGLVLGVMGSALYWKRKMDHQRNLRGWEHNRLLAGYDAALKALGVDRRGNEFEKACIKGMEEFEKAWPPPRPGDVLDQSIQQFRHEEDNRRAAALGLLRRKRK